AFILNCRPKFFFMPLSINIFEIEFSILFFKKLSHFSLESSTETIRTSKLEFPANFLAISITFGRDSRQGAHQVAQTSMKTTFPIKSPKRNEEPSSVSPVKSKAFSPLWVKKNLSEYVLIK